MNRYLKSHVRESFLCMTLLFPKIAMLMIILLNNWTFISYFPLKKVGLVAGQEGIGDIYHRWLELLYEILNKAKVKSHLNLYVTFSLFYLNEVIQLFVFPLKHYLSTSNSKTHTLYICVLGSSPSALLRLNQLRYPAEKDSGLLVGEGLDMSRQCALAAH